MKDNQAEYPQLRFKGFTDPWEQSKTKELCDISTGKGNTQDKVEDGKYPFYVRSATIERSNEYLYDQEAVLTVGDGVGTGKVFHYVNGKYNLHQRVYRMFNFNHGVSAKYFYHYFSKNFYRRVMSMTAKTSVDSVRMEMIADMKIKFPSPAEQETIVSALDGVDDLISLHQRKLEKLQELKQGYLQKMFPKNGSKFPQLRFAGFADTWEQRKLETFTSLITKQTGFDYSATIKPALVNKPEGNVYPFIQNKNFSGFKINMNTDFYIPIEVAHKFPRITLDQPSLLVTISGNIGNVGIYNSDEKAFIGGAVGICKLNNLVEGEFILYELESDFGQRQFKRSTKSSSHANITVEMIKNIDILIPKNELEIEKIGTFFKELDDTIALHQRKLEKLQELKKGYLQKMFF